MRKNLILLITFTCVLQVFCNSNPVINPNSLKKVFDAAKPYSDLTNAFYSVKGLSLLGEKLPAESHQELCTYVKTKVDKTSLESIFYATSIAAQIPNCQLNNADFQAALTAGSNSQKVPDLYYYNLVSANLKTPVDSKKIAKNLVDGLKADSSILNQAYSLHIAATLTEGEKTFYDSIEDILDQADEVDKKYLQYEGGVGTTSLVLEGILLLSEKVKQLPAKFDQQRLAKFINYLTSKRSPTNIKSAFFLLRTALKLTDNQFLVPVILNRLSSVSISSTQPNLLISLTNIIGRPVKAQFNVEAESAKSRKPNGPALFTAKKSFVSKSSDGSTFEVKLIDNQQLTADFYTVTVNAVAKESPKKFVLVQNKVEVKLSTAVNLVDVQVGVADRDQSAPKLTKIDENTKLKEKLEGDQQSKFHLRFGVKDKLKGSLIEAHQTFVKFTSTNGREIIFLAQAATNNQYVAEIDFATNSKNFRQQSGVYTVELVVSDPLIENPISWQLGEIKLQLGGEEQKSVDKQSIYSKRPEIKHLFRPPEPTPPAIVSTVFAALCVAPLALMLLLWLGIGFNFSKFSFSLSGIAFHLSLAAIFGLFYCYWIKLNMFQTVRWLALLGFVALVSGNKLLKNLAAKSEKKN